MKLKLFAILCMITVGASAQSIESVNFTQLQAKLDSSKGKVVVMNFWSTWCVPCVEELPDFEKLGADYKDKNVEVVLVNLDFNSKMDSKVMPFIKKHNLQSTLYHLTDTDANTWVDKVDETWSGSIPATVIYEPGGKKVFFNEGKLSYDQLVQTIQPFLTKP